MNTVIPATPATDESASPVRLGEQVDTSSPAVLPDAAPSGASEEVQKLLLNGSLIQQLKQQVLTELLMASGALSSHGAGTDQVGSLTASAPPALPPTNKVTPQLLRVASRDMRRLSKSVDWKLPFRERNGVLQDIFQQYRDAQARVEVVTYDMILDLPSRDAFDDWWKSAGAIEHGHDWWTRFHAIRRKNVSPVPSLPSDWRELDADALEWFILSEWARYYRSDADQTIKKQFSVKMEWSETTLDQIDTFLSALKAAISSTESYRGTPDNDRLLMESVIEHGIMKNAQYEPQYHLGQKLLSDFKSLANEEKTWDFIIREINFRTRVQINALDESHLLGWISRPRRWFGNAQKPHGLIGKRDLPHSDDEGDAKSVSESAKKKAKHDESRVTCFGCGKKHRGGTANCALANHPLFNRSNVPWHKSEIGKAFKAKGHNVLVESIKDIKELKNERESSTRSPTKPTDKPERKGESAFVAALASQSKNTYTLYVVHENRKPKAVETLIDSGAEAGNCIDANLADKLRQEGYVVASCVCSSCSLKVCPVLDNLPCIQTRGRVKLNIQFPQQVIALSFNILPLSERQMIIGIDDIRRHDITRLCREFFVEDNSAKAGSSICNPVIDDDNVSPRMVQNPVDKNVRDNDGDRPGQSYLVGAMGGPKRPTECTRSLTYCQRGNEFEGCLVHIEELLNLSEGVPENDVFWRDDIVTALTGSNSVGWAAKGSRPHKTCPKEGKSLLASMRSVDAHNREPVPLEPATKNSDLVLPTIIGNETVHVAARRIVEKHWRVFSRTVNPDPADVAPMELRLVDERKWRVNSNSLAPRVQSLQKENALKEIIALLLKQRIISASQATHYSQVLLVPKPGRSDAWRLCIDYRALNEVLEGMGWPIPHIQHMIERIGRKRPKWFAVLDLTSGYHQVLLSPNSREYAAFITPFGTFVPNRISMGLKSAPAYFQQQIQTTVIADLMYVAAELYIDDIVAYGSTEEEFLEHLDRILQRLEDKRITLNPDKAKIAVSEVEAVGHVLDQYGIKMSIEKIQKVMQFPPPRYGKNLKQFLGMANYFRRHINGYAKIARPLELLIRDYKNTKARVIQWTDEARAALHRLQAEIAACPKLYFLRHDVPIILETDASEYAIGAYLYQVVDNEQQPIAFMSRSLSGAQINWSTIEKECFAIYSALREWEYLLRDVQFTIRTDHKNLRYLNTNTPKVVRWKLAVQEFNFFVSYVPGEENVVADTLSRIVRHDTLRSETDDNADIDDIPSDRSAEGEKADQESNDDQVSGEPNQSIGTVAALVPQRLDHDGPLRPVEHHSVNRYTPEIAEKIMSVHNSYRGHFGVDRTIAILQREQGSWLHMRNHVRQFIAECPSCQKMKDIKPIIVSLPFTTATYSPFSRINMDTIGPLPTDEDKNAYILVLIDCFSRFVELYAIPSTEARPCAKCLINFTGRYGAPEYLLSDRGSQFVNQTIKEMLRIMGTQQMLSLAYSKQENAIVERANKEIMRHLRGIVFDTRIKNEWSLVLPLVQRIMNSHPHDSIGVAPAQIIFGNSIQLDRGILFRGDHIDITNPNVLTPTIKQYLDKLLSVQSKTSACAQHHQYETDQARLRAVAKKGKGETPTVFPVNSYVLLQYHSGLGNHQGPTKLHTRWQGPFRVIKSRGSQYTLQNLVTLRESVHHIQELAPFHWNAELVDPKEVAWRDQDRFQVESIISHQGDMRRVSTLTFRVRWQGFPPEEDTIEPWKNLRSNAALHAYLRRSGQESKIPREFLNA